MTGLFSFPSLWPSAKAARLGVCVAVFASAFAFAQEQQPGQQPVQPQAPQQQPAAPPAAPAPEHKPGSVEAFGRWFDDSAAEMRKGFDNMWKGMGSASKGTADAAKGTVDALGKLGGSRVISGRERCLPAPNGAPDCQAAAAKICKAAGYNTGVSADFVTSEECPASAYANGRQPPPGECPVEHVVTKAVCSQ